MARESRCESCSHARARVRRALILVAGLLLFGVTCSPASAEVSFASDRPLKLDFDRVATRAGRVTVAVRNDDSKPQKIELRLTGLTVI